MKGLYAYCITMISPSQRRRLEDHHPIVKELAKPAAGWDDAARHGFNQVDMSRTCHMCNIMKIILISICLSVCLPACLSLFLFLSLYLSISLYIYIYISWYGIHIMLPRAQEGAVESQFSEFTVRSPGWFSVGKPPKTYHDWSDWGWFIPFMVILKIVYP